MLWWTLYVLGLHTFLSAHRPRPEHQYYHPQVFVGFLIAEIPLATVCLIVHLWLKRLLRNREMMEPELPTDVTRHSGNVTDASEPILDRKFQTFEVFET